MNKKQNIMEKFKNIKSSIFFYVSGYFKRISSKSTINTKEVENSIMTLLTYNNYSELSTSETLDLFNNIEKRVEKLVEERRIKAINELKVTRSFCQKLNELKTI